MYHRAGDLDYWPTKAFADDPETYVRWALEHFPDLVAEVAPEFGLRLVRAD